VDCILPPLRGSGAEALAFFGVRDVALKRRSSTVAQAVVFLHCFIPHPSKIAHSTPLCSLSAGYGWGSLARTFLIGIPTSRKGGETWGTLFLEYCENPKTEPPG
jgi:hypothetical protein